MTSPRSLRTLMSGLIDYAGLFPPAKLDMKDAVSRYAGYRSGPHSWMLGRFVLPVSRIKEFDDAAPSPLPRGEGSDPWRLTAIVDGDPEDDGERMLKFNCAHWPGSEIGHAVIDSAELRLTEKLSARKARKAIPRFFIPYLETELNEDLDAHIAEIGRAGARAKVRSGGVTPETFPSAAHVAEFITECIRREVPFKATAGLHHAVRGDYPLTYEPGSPCGTMYGFLNVFVAAAALTAGSTIEEAQRILEERDLSAFTFSDDGLTWGSRKISVGDVRQTRTLAISLGSCSFEEPVAELTAAGLL